MIPSAVIFALLLGILIFAVLPRGRVWQRTVAATAYVLLVAIVYGGSIDLLGRPKPVRLEWRDLQEAQVLGSSLRENQAIYVWLQASPDSEPLSYALPWDMKMAQQLQTAMEEGEANGTGVQMNLSKETGQDTREPMFYALPQAALPDKNYSAIPLATNLD
jgi:hypothetical protein